MYIDHKYVIMLHTDSPTCFGLG